MNTDQKAWPSPRSWEMASQLFKNNISIDIAVGEGSSQNLILI